MVSIITTAKIGSIMVIPPPKITNRVPAPASLRRTIVTRPRILMGAGTTNPSQRVIEAISRPLMGIHSDDVHQIMDEVRDGLKYIFQTKNPVTFCASGSGTSGMETVLGNLIEKGDVVLIAITGYFGQRAANLATRYGAVVHIVESKLGTSIKYDQICAHFEAHKPKLLFVAHGDSSTGVLQSLDGLGELCRRHDCLLVVDAVSTLGTVELLVDEWKIDAAFSATQKGLGALAGMAPVTLGSRALARIAKRTTSPPVYYYDANLLKEFWKCTDAPRLPHHTISVIVLYALRETIAEIIEQTLEGFQERHTDNAQRLYEGLQNIGLEVFVEWPEERMPSITSVRIPHGVKLNGVCKHMLDRYSLEISPGFGLTEGIIFRIGTMNANSTHQKVDLLLRALYEALKETSNYIAPASKIYY